MHFAVIRPIWYWLLLGIMLLILVAVGIWSYAFKMPSSNPADYPIQGFDVSHHQQNIDWHRISPERYAFVYIKATEGGDFNDRLFQQNWQQAHQHGFHVGAYHFYRLCRDGQVQADHFIATVPKRADALPPAIDLEYDSKCIDTYTKEQHLKHIKIMHDALQAHYGKQPIFYVSKRFYNIVLAGHFKDTPLWVREYQGLPELKNQAKWHFWQHSQKGRIEGISTPVDLNVFYGSAEVWKQFLKDAGIEK